MRKADKTRARSGLPALKQRVSVRGMRAVDGRSQAMRAVCKWKADLVRDLGGDPSTQRLTLIDSAAKTMLFLNHIDSWLMQQDCLINKRARRVLPVLRERMMLADSLARVLAQLGLERVPKPIQDLRAYIADFDKRKEQTDGDAA